MDYNSDSEKTIKRNGKHIVSDTFTELYNDEISISIDNLSLDIEYMDNFINIPEISSDCQFWMIRTNRGVFYDEYIKENFIAIGWNFLKKSTLDNLSKSATERLKENLQQVYPFEKRPQMLINKSIRFISEMMEDDIAVVMGTQNVAFVKIGEYYELSGEEYSIEKEIETRELIQNNDRTITFCPYIKRRKIEIIKELPIELISPYLSNSIITNHHSLSNLNDAAELILCSCYDLFIYDGKLINTFRVQQKENIDSLDYSTFVYNVSKILSLVSPENKIILKTNVHSEGDIIFTILDFVKEYWYVFAILYVVMFGGKFKDFEFNSLWKLISNIIHSKDIKKVKELEIKEKKADIKKKKCEIKLMEIQIAEKEKELLQNSINEINTSAEALKIKPVDLKIINTNFELEETEDSSVDKT